MQWPIIYDFNKHRFSRQTILFKQHRYRIRHCWSHFAESPIQSRNQVTEFDVSHQLFERREWSSWHEILDMKNILNKSKPMCIFFWHHFSPLFIFSCQNNVTISFIIEQDKIRIKSRLLLWTNLLYSSLCIKRKARMVQAHLDPDCWSGARYSTEAVAFVFSEERNDLCFLFVSLQLSFLVETARPTFPLRRGTNKNDTMLQSTDGSRCPRRKTRSTWASYIATKFFS